MSDKTICHRCNRKWPNNSEQAACIRIYNKCIVCCVDLEKTKDYQWSIDAVQKERSIYIKAINKNKKIGNKPETGRIA